METVDKLVKLSESMMHVAALLVDEDPTGENGVTWVPISNDLHIDGSLNNKSIILQINNKSQQVYASALRHSIQDRLSKGAGGKGCANEIYLKLRTSTCLFTSPILRVMNLLEGT
ncbi:uncharacterized protein A4U43_C08F12830 [Asparagus officinalis]|nr:uncharacterized protein A4U43_C08F12830 [Asparagus officinalis]